jgi:replicative DNA helicase
MAQEKKERTRRPASRQSGILEGGKLPPQAVDLEEAVLGALMLDKSAPEKVMDLMKPESFYKDAHNFIFEVISELFEAGEAIDILTVTARLRQNGKLDQCGGAYYITQLTNRVSSAANIEFHAHVIVEKYIQRELIRITGDITQKAFEETTDAFELLDQAEKDLFAIKNDSIKRNYDSIDALINKAIHQIESLKDTEGGLTGIPSGFTSLDRITAGWQRSDLVILAGRPGMGKTAFVLNLARNAAVDFGKGVAIFSLEMSSVQLVTRLISSETELSAEKFKTGNLKDYEWEQLNTKVEKLSDAPIYIDDTPALSIFDLKAKARRLKSQKNIELLIIDYLQLMKGEEKSSGNREQEISYISRSLKGLAKELDIPVIALAQLSRAVEQRPDKKPILSDLRESGSIEQDADMVGFIYRGDYYGFNEDPEGNDITGLAEIIIAKHRNGPTATAKVRFRKEFARFTDLDEHFSLPPTSGDQTVTFGSKMNDPMSDFDYGDDPPF